MSKSRSVSFKGPWNLANDVIFRYEEGLYHVARFSDLSSNYTLQDTAASIWLAVFDGHNYEEILRQLEETHGELDSEKRGWVQDFISSLLEEKLIEAR